MPEHTLPYDPLPTGREPDWQLLLREAIPFVEACARELAAAGRIPCAAGVLVLGFNGYRGSDAEFFPGLQAGLSRLALERLGKTLRACDAYEHLGGDLFGVVPRSTGDPGALAMLAGRLLRAFETPLKWGEREFVVRPAIGIAVAPRDGGDTGLLVHRAWTAQDRAWELNRARFRFASEDLNHRLSDELARRAGEALAIASGQGAVVLEVQDPAGRYPGALVTNFRGPPPADFAWNGPTLHEAGALADKLVQARFAVGWARVQAAPSGRVELLLPDGFLRQAYAATALMGMLGERFGASGRTRLWVPEIDLPHPEAIERNLAIARAASMPVGAQVCAANGLPLRVLRALDVDALLFVDPPGPVLEAMLDYVARVLPGGTVLSYSPRLSMPELTLCRLVHADAMLARATTPDAG